MSEIRKLASAMALASTVVLGSCTYDGHGYGGVSVGYGTGWYDDYYPYGYAPYGWYDGYYYPGNGYWLYDRRGVRHRWSDNHRRYWEGRREHAGKWDGPSTRPWRQETGERRRWSRKEVRGGENRIPRGASTAVPERSRGSLQERAAPDRGGSTPNRVPRIPRGN